MNIVWKSRIPETTNVLPLEYQVKQDGKKLTVQSKQGGVWVDENSPVVKSAVFEAAFRSRL
jgi:hypothetical protein